jgi:hypothetical protein
MHCVSTPKKDHVSGAAMALMHGGRLTPTTLSRWSALSPLRAKRAGEKIGK